MCSTRKVNVPHRTRAVRGREATRPPSAPKPVVRANHLVFPDAEKHAAAWATPQAAGAPNVQAFSTTWASKDGSKEGASTETRSLSGSSGQRIASVSNFTCSSAA